MRRRSRTKPSIRLSIVSVDAPSCAATVMDPTSWLPVTRRCSVRNGTITVSS
jgi:hypothetical protein